MPAAPSSDSGVDFDVVSVQGVSRHFGRRRALARVSIECRTGQIIGLLGPNGSGKSTLLGVLSTLVRPSSGEVLYGSRPARSLGDGLRARIGMLGHDLFLYGDLSARENLAFFGRLYALADLELRLEDGLREARLTDRAHDRVSGFSRGLRQRLALERALLHRPRLLLLDEPFTGLDDESSSLLVDRLKTLRERGVIVVMATHDFESAEAVVDVPVCLRDGRLLPVPEGRQSLRDRYRRALAETSA
jgi:ABC-type multidrug transport system ATPase subunit